MHGSLGAIHVSPGGLVWAVAALNSEHVLAPCQLRLSRRWAECPVRPAARLTVTPVCPGERFDCPGSSAQAGTHTCRLVLLEETGLFSVGLSGSRTPASGVVTTCALL